MTGVLLFLLFSFSLAWADEATSTDIPVKSKVIYMQPTILQGDVQLDPLEGIEGAFPSKGKGISAPQGKILGNQGISSKNVDLRSAVPVNVINELLVAFDDVFGRYETVAKKSRIKTLEFGIATTAEGKLYIVNAQATSSIKIVLERKE
jgi:hypothetical protein